ncbi:hypothetical protein BGZ65_005867 [Modicella reniformis]|uniref:Uncharacterized protein n=1 Tax=Modicella reniformis TaxID=1440133 RepID=A0A9P6J5C6_9FUNG|nr:hypothetical protein BGZ65_005867 [Modicella reniformis]
MIKRKNPPSASGASVIRVSKKRLKRVSGTAPPESKVEHFKSYFTDPPNVDDILSGVLEGEFVMTQQNEALEEDEEQDSEELGATTASTSKAPFRGVRFFPINRARIFRAVLFLKHNLRNMAQLEKEDFRLSITRYGTTFKKLAEQLAQQQPALIGISGTSLYSLYSDIIKKRRELNEFLYVATGDPWFHTKLCDLAQDLLELENEMEQREEKKSSKKAALLAEAIAKEKSLIFTGMIGRRLNGKEPAADGTTSRTFASFADAGAAATGPEASGPAAPGLATLGPAATDLVVRPAVAGSAAAARPFAVHPTLTGSSSQVLASLALPSLALLPSLRRLLGLRHW